MKRKILACLLLAALLLTGCANTDKSSSNEAVWDYVPEETGASIGSDDVYYRDMAPGDMALESSKEGYFSGTGSVTTGDLTVADPNRKLIRTVSLEAETEDFDALMKGLAEQITALSGYVEEQHIYGNRAGDTDALRSADLTVRIPSEKLNQFVTQVEQLSNVVSSSQTAEDVTLQYSDTESRVKALEVERDRLMDLLEKAETTQDLLEIESRLTEVRYELEGTQSQLRLYGNLVSYSTVYLDLQEVRVLTPTQEPTVWERTAQGFKSTLENLSQFFVNLFVAGVSALPIWLPVALVVILLWVFLHRASKKRKKQEPLEK